MAVCCRLCGKWFAWDGKDGILVHVVMEHRGSPQAEAIWVSLSQPASVSG